MVDARESGATELYELIEGGRKGRVAAMIQSRCAGCREKREGNERIACSNRCVAPRRGSTGDGGEKLYVYVYRLRCRIVERYR